MVHNITGYWSFSRRDKRIVKDIRLFDKNKNRLFPDEWKQPILVCIYTGLPYNMLFISNLQNFKFSIIPLIGTWC